METIAEFLAMGGDGAFIWPAYAVTLLVMVVLLAVSLHQARANQTALDRMQATRPPRRAARPTPEPAETDRDS